MGDKPIATPAMRCPRGPPFPFLSGHSETSFLSLSRNETQALLAHHIASRPLASPEGVLQCADMCHPFPARTRHGPCWQVGRHSALSPPSVKPLPGTDHGPCSPGPEPRPEQPPTRRRKRGECQGRGPGRGHGGEEGGSRARLRSPIPPAHGPPTPCDVISLRKAAGTKRPQGQHPPEC